MLPSSGAHAGSGIQAKAGAPAALGAPDGLVGSGPEEAWYDEEAGPVVRPYAVTGGRTRPVRGNLDLITLVVARSVPAGPAPTSPELREIVERCQRPLSVAEIAAGLNLPVGTVRVLIGDLLDAGLVDTQDPPLLADLPSEALLQAVLTGLRAL